jgi:isocitrate/isopropylmalate dehydrogenase
MKILILEGDGIGPDIVAAAVNVLKAADRRFHITEITYILVYWYDGIKWGRIEVSWHS